MSQEPVKIHVTWEEYLALLRELFEAIDASDFKPEQIVCIARGGLIPGNLASLFFEVPLAVISVASYPDHATHQEDVHFSRALTTARPLRRKGGVLLMDDLTETGVTLRETVKWLCYWESVDPEAIRTAVVWHKVWSGFKPDFYAEMILEGPNGERPWIVQPAEGFRRRSR